MLLSITLFDTLLVTIVCLVILKFNSLFSLSTVNFTSVFSLPLISLITSSTVFDSTELPLTFVTTSPDFIPAFAAGDSSIGDIIVILLFSLLTPM